MSSPRPNSGTTAIARAGDPVASLETTFLVDLLRGDPDAIARGKALEEAGEPKCVTPPAVAELLIGAHWIGGTELELAADLVDSLTLLEFDVEACQEAGRLGASLMARGDPMSTVDLLIAAVSKRHGQRLITRNRGFTRVRGLAVETY